MPNHKFKCRKCGKSMERIVMHEERNAKCDCGGEADRQLSAPDFRFGKHLKLIEKI